MSPEDMLEKLEKKLEKLDSRLDSVDLTLARNTMSLEHHIARTDALEERIEQFKDELTPIQSHVAAWGGVLKAVTVLGVLCGIVFGAWKLFG